MFDSTKCPRLDELLSQHDTVVVCFSATWCRPCKVMESVVKEAQVELGGAAAFLLLDSEQAPETALQLGVRVFPSFIAFKGGVRVATKRGAEPRHHFLNWVHKLVGLQQCAPGMGQLPLPLAAEA